MGQHPDHTDGVLCRRPDASRWRDAAVRSQSATRGGTPDELGPASGTEGLFGIEKLNVPRSTVPAVTHGDDSARVQTVRRDDNPLYYDIIHAFDTLTGCPVIVNTSFNVKDEPIVCTLEDAYRCFMKTQMDVLILESHVIVKPAA